MSEFNNQDMELYPDFEDFDFEVKEEQK